MKNLELQGRLAKERDYLVIESRSFFSEITSMLSFYEMVLLPRNVDNADILNLLTEVNKDLSNHNLKNINKHTDVARSLSWKYLKTKYENQSAMILFLLNMFSEFIKLDSKFPAEYDLELRKKSERQTD